MKKLMLLLFIPFFIFGQSNQNNGNLEVPFATVENVPIFPGCEIGDNETKRKCMANNISRFVQRNFNTGLADDLGLTGRQRISVIFRIDKGGYVTGISSRAPHPRLEEEAIRVISLLPKMEPGKHKGKTVIVLYSLPIIFEIQGDNPSSKVSSKYQNNIPPPPPPPTLPQGQFSIQKPQGWFDYSSDDSVILNVK